MLSLRHHPHPFAVRADRHRPAVASYVHGFLRQAFVQPLHHFVMEVRTGF